MTLKAAPPTYEFEPYATLSDLTDAIAELNAAGISGDSQVRVTGMIEFNKHGVRIVKLTVSEPDTDPPTGRHAA